MKAGGGVMRYLIHFLLSSGILFITHILADAFLSERTSIARGVFYVSGVIYACISFYVAEGMK